MTALREVMDGIESGLDWIGRQAGPSGLLAALLVFGYALAWRLIR